MRSDEAEDEVRAPRLFGVFDSVAPRFDSWSLGRGIQTQLYSHSSCKTINSISFPTITILKSRFPKVHCA